MLTSNELVLWENFWSTYVWAVPWRLKSSVLWQSILSPQLLGCTHSSCQDSGHIVQGFLLGWYSQLFHLILWLTLVFVGIFCYCWVLSSPLYPAWACIFVLLPSLSYGKSLTYWKRPTHFPGIKLISTFQKWGCFTVVGADEPQQIPASLQCVITEKICATKISLMAKN